MPAEIPNVSLKRFEDATISGNYPVDSTPVEEIVITELNPCIFKMHKDISKDPVISIILNKLKELIKSSQLSVKRITKGKGDIDSSETENISMSKDLPDVAFKTEIERIVINLMSYYWIYGIVVVKWGGSKHRPEIAIPTPVSWDEIRFFRYVSPSEKEGVYDRGFFAIPRYKNVTEIDEIPPSTPYHVHILDPDNMGKVCDLTSEIERISGLVIDMKETRDRLQEESSKKETNEMVLQRAPMSKETLAEHTRHLTSGVNMDHDMGEITPETTHKLNIISTWRDSELDKKQAELSLRDINTTRKRKKYDDDDDDTILFSEGCDDQFANSRRKIRKFKREKDEMCVTGGSNVNVLAQGVNVISNQRVGGTDHRLLEAMMSLYGEQRNQIAMTFGLEKNFFSYNRTTRSGLGGDHKKSESSYRREHGTLSANLQRTAQNIFNSLYEGKNILVTKKEVSEYRKRLEKESPMPLQSDMEATEGDISLDGSPNEVKVSSGLRKLFERKKKIDEAVEEYISQKRVIKVEYVGSGVMNLGLVRELHASGYLKHDAAFAAYSAALNIPSESFKVPTEGEVLRPRTLRDGGDILDVGERRGLL